MRPVRLRLRPEEKVFLGTATLEWSVVHFGWAYVHCPYCGKRVGIKGVGMPTKGACLHFAGVLLSSPSGFEVVFRDWSRYDRRSLWEKLAELARR